MFPCIFDQSYPKSRKRRKRQRQLRQLQTRSWVLDSRKPHGNHGNDENHGNPGCKPRVPQTTGLEIPDIFDQFYPNPRTYFWLFLTYLHYFGASGPLARPQLHNTINCPRISVCNRGDLVARAIRNAIRANRFARIIRTWNPCFYSVSGRFARITRISDSRESPDSHESCESIRANHATKRGEIHYANEFSENIWV